MAETSTMFLTLTPTSHQLDNREQVPSPSDQVTLNLAVESLSYRLVSGDVRGSLASSQKSAFTQDSAFASQGSSTPIEQNRPEPSPVDGTLTDEISAPSTVTHIDNPVLPPVQNDKQDTVAGEHDVVSDQQEPVVTTLPTKFLSPATVLKHRLENTKDLIVCPGVYDGFSARIALSVGFDALYMVGNLPILHSPQANSHQLDWCWHYGFSPWTTRSRHRSAE